MCVKVDSAVCMCVCVGGCTCPCVCTKKNEDIKCLDISFSAYSLEMGSLTELGARLESRKP